MIEAAPAEVAAVTRPGTAEVVLTGELDIATVRGRAGAARGGRSAARADAAGHRPGRRCEFVDSTGVRLVLSADERAREAGRRLALRLGDGSARRVFTALGLVDRFEVLD